MGIGLRVQNQNAPLPEADRFKYYKLHLIIFLACSKNKFLFNMIFFNRPAPLPTERSMVQISLVSSFLNIFFFHIALNVLEQSRTSYRILVREIPS
jgi:hypothetical protein